MNAAATYTKASRVNLVLAFAAVYVIWGSTYLAIRFAVETLPPFVMMGTRFLLGGAFFYVWTRSQGVPLPSRNQVTWTSIVGILMLCGGTGVVGWAEQWVPSGLTALIISGSPFWFVLFDWLRPNGMKPNRTTALGLVIGFAGIVILIGPDKIASGGAVDLVAAGALIVASACWALGSIASRHVDMPMSQQMTAAIQLLAAALVCIGFGLLTGEGSELHWEAMSIKSLAALGYLTVFGAVAYAAYVWLLKVCPPSKVSTYAYVNPLVAVVLGTTLGGEQFTLRIALASAVIIGAVVVITAAKARKAETQPATRLQVADAEAS